MAARGGDVDALVVGSGPNGLSAAVELARAGLSVRVIEARDEIGGGTRTAELTLPGFRHDVCSAIHPLALASPFFRKLRLDQRGVEFLQPAAALAHPLDDGRVALLERSPADTAASLDSDGPAYEALMKPLLERAGHLFEDLLAPLRLPSHPLALARFGLRGAWGAERLGRRFRDAPARALIAGAAAHSIQPLDRPPTGGLALLLLLSGHAVGWPLVRGGTSEIARGLNELILSLGGEIETGHEVKSLDDLPPARAILLDVTPRQLVKIAGDRLPSRFRRRMQAWRHGPAVFKLDYALDGPIPWSAPECARAATVHLGGTMEEIAYAEREVYARRASERPFVLLAQPTLFDASRAPEGQHTVWAYCHAPAGAKVDLADAVERQIERFAPGFRDRVLARHALNARDLEAYNPNYVGGDITGGVQDLRQIVMRPSPRWDPYSTPVEGIYLCSSSTPPGAGVHGMCGYLAARSALRRSF